MIKHILVHKTCVTWRGHHSTGLPAGRCAFQGSINTRNLLTWKCSYILIFLRCGSSLLDAMNSTVLTLDDFGVSLFFVEDDFLLTVPSSICCGWIGIVGVSSAEQCSLAFGKVGFVPPFFSFFSLNLNL